MKTDPYTPARAVALLAHLVREAEYRVEARAKELQYDLATLAQTTASTRTVNSLGELQARPAHLEAAVGAVHANRAAMELMARTAPQQWEPGDWDLLQYACASSAWLQALVATFGWQVAP
jgi:hypothetical protein